MLRVRSRNGAVHLASRRDSNDDRRFWLAAMLVCFGLALSAAPTAAAAPPGLITECSKPVCDISRRGCTSGRGTSA
jgi:hypothetical protein